VFALVERPTLLEPELIILRHLRSRWAQMAPEHIPPSPLRPIKFLQAHLSISQPWTGERLASCNASSNCCDAIVTEGRPNHPVMDEFVGTNEGSDTTGGFNSDSQGNWVEVSATPGPIPGSGFLSYIALGLLGLGSLGWKRLRAG
jgi:hypothetical protein